MKSQPTDADLAAAAASAEVTIMKLEDAPMSDVIDALASGRFTATALTKGYRARIEAYDRAGPMLNSVRELNPDALTIAGKLDDTKPSAKRPLAGIPILVKDNIATGDNSRRRRARWRWRVRVPGTTPPSSSSCAAPAR